MYTHNLSRCEWRLFMGFLSNWSDGKKWVMGILSAIILILISYVFKNSVSGNERIFKTTIDTPLQIVEKFRNARSFEKSAIADSYKGIDLNIEAKLESISKSRYNMSVFLFSKDKEVIIVGCIGVDIESNIALKVIDKGEQLLISGEIVTLDDHSIQLTNCTFNTSAKTIGQLIKTTK